MSVIGLFRYRFGCKIAQIFGNAIMEKNWKIISEKDIYVNRWISVTEYGVINPNGGEGIYGKVHMNKLAIGILPIDAEGNIYLVGQQRFTINQYSWELPEGGGEAGEDPLESAKRELREETGLVAGSWEHFLEMHTSNSVTDEKAIVYIARQLSQKGTAFDDTEDIHIKKIPFREALQQVLNGTITDAISMAAILKWALVEKQG